MCTPSIIASIPIKMETRGSSRNCSDRKKMLEMQKKGLQGKQCRRLLEAVRSKEWILPRSLQKQAALPTS